LSGNDYSALSQSADTAIRGTVTDVKCAPRHPRTRTNAHVHLVYGLATATAMQMRQIPWDHRIMNPLCAANTGRRVSPPLLFFSLSLSQSFPSTASRCAHCSLECRRPSPFLLFPSTSTSLSLPCRAERGQAALNEMSQVSYRLPS